MGYNLGIHRPRKYLGVVPAHPKAQLRSESGITFTLRWAPRGGDLAGWADTFDTIGRPGRTALVQRTADGTPTTSLEFLVAHLDHQQDIEAELATLRLLSESGERITLVNLSPQEAGPWRIENVTISASLRQAGTNRFTRAVVSLSLIAASDGNALLGPRYKLKSPKKTIYIKVKKGDTLRNLAHKYYGDPAQWSTIAKANKLKDVKLKKGKKLKIPKIDV